MWKTTFPLVFSLLSCTTEPFPPTLPPYKGVEQDFCYREAQVETEAFAPDKDLRLRELHIEHGEKILVAAAKKSCQQDVDSYFPTPDSDEKKRLEAACEFFRIEDYRKLNQALVAQIEIACDTRTEDLCHGLPLDSRKAKRACIERNEPRRIEALALGQSSVGGIE